MSKFDKVYKRYDAFMEAFNLYKTSEIIGMLRLRGNERVADIGGGTGAIAREVAKRCKEVYVIDESKGMLSMVERNSNIKAVQADAADTGLKGESFDIVIITDVIHHIKGQKAVLEESRRLLKKGGRLLILDFEKSHFLVRLLYVFEFVLFGRVHYRTLGEMTGLVEFTGFDVKNVLKKGYYYIIVGERNY